MMNATNNSNVSLVKLPSTAATMVVTFVRRIDANREFPGATDAGAMRFALLRYSPHDQW